MSSADLWSWNNRTKAIEPWEPTPLTFGQWPPNYPAVYAWRIQQLELLRDPQMLASANAYYSTRPVAFITHWMDTYNPRSVENKWMPFVFFQRQSECTLFIDQCQRDGENGLIEKARDMGVTWNCCGYSVYRWKYISDDVVNWGSRKEELVDRLGDPDSIFEKMRLIIARLPECFRPAGYNPKYHATERKIINPENGAIIKGESGKNIGRGGRSSITFKDESAHYEQPEAIDAALSDNTDCQIDISSVNGVGNVFWKKRQAGIEWQPGAPRIERGYTRVFIADWRHNPAKSQEWYDRRRAKAVREGLLHLFAQEVERDYASAMQNRIIDAEWIHAAVDAHLRISWLTPAMLSDVWQGAMDVADEGADRNALAKRQGIVLRFASEWGERDPGVSCRNVVQVCANMHRNFLLQYDCIGVGVAVKAEYNRLIDAKINLNGLQLIPWNAGASVMDPFANIIPDDEESPINKDYFVNIKAQAWQSLASRFYKTWRAVTAGDVYPVDELISIDGSLPLKLQIIAELSQPTQKASSSLKMLVDKKPNGTKSPNIADAICMAYFPVTMNSGIAVQGMHGNVRI